MVHTLVFLQTAPYPTGFFICDLCHEKGSGAVFHCSACHFDLHPSCIGTGEQVSHFLHFQHPLYLETVDSNNTTCDVCSYTAFPSMYHCDECDFDMHPHCACASRFIQHPSHKHTLQLTPKVDAYSGSCWCDGCGKEATGLVYHCTSCNYDLHIPCAILPRKPFHIKHPEHRLKLFSKTCSHSQRALCAECGKDTSKWIYGCEACGFYLHVGCANLPGHVVASVPSSLGDSYSLTSSNDVEVVVKMMDRLLFSSSIGVTSSENTAARRVMKMLEQQLHNVPVSLSPAALRLTSGGDRNTCPTCLDEYESDKQRRDLRCGHHFHTGCILRWMDSSNRCPVCRQQVMFMDGL